MAMSKLTEAMMRNCDYAFAKERRLSNFAYLREYLPTIFPLNLSDDNVPMVYPYVTDTPNLRDRLIREKIFVPKYWPDVINCEALAERIIPLPIDQRYGEEDMKRIVEVVGNA